MSDFLFAPNANWEAIAFAFGWFTISVIVCSVIERFSEAKKR